MTLTPLGELRKAQAIAVYDWFRRRLVLIIVALMLVLQFLTWRSIERLAESQPRSPPRCSDYDPCSVYVRGAVALDPETIRRLKP